MIARSTPWGTIQLGDEYYLLTEEEQKAVIAHEKGHIAHFHAWKRLWWFVTLRAFFNTRGFLEMCEAQELEADRYAADRGHAHGLVMFLFRRTQHVKSPGYPTNAKRLEELYD